MTVGGTALPPAPRTGTRVRGPKGTWAAGTVQPHSRWRDGWRDDDARHGHNADTRRYRRELRRAELPEAAIRRLLAALEHGDSLATAAEAVGITVALIWGRAHWDSEFAERLEVVLAAVCPGGSQCGTISGYRAGGRDTACRAAKRADRH